MQEKRETARRSLASLHNKQFHILESWMISFFSDILIGAQFRALEAADRRTREGLRPLNRHCGLQHCKACSLTTLVALAAV